MEKRLTSYSRTVKRKNNFSSLLDSTLDVSDNDQMLFVVRYAEVYSSEAKMSVLFKFFSMHCKEKLPKKISSHFSTSLKMPWM